MKSFSGITAAVFMMAASLSAQDLKIDFNKDTSGWDFNSGGEFPGAKGSFTLIDMDGKKVGCLKGNFNEGGAYVAVYKNLPPDTDISSLIATVKSAQVANLVIRIVDSTGQTFQHKLAVKDGNGWNELELNTPATQKAFWGGANDGKWHGPAKLIGIILDKNSIRSGMSAEIYIRSIEIIKE